MSKIIYKGMKSDVKKGVTNVTYLEFENGKYTDLIDNTTYKAGIIGGPITEGDVKYSNLTVISREELIKELRNVKETAYILVKPDGVVNLGGILEMITRLNLTIVKIEKHLFTSKEAKERYAHLKDNKEYSNIVLNLIQDESYIVEVNGENALKKLSAIKGPKNPKASKESEKNTIRYLFGSTTTCNAVEVAKNEEEGIALKKLMRK